YRGRHRASAKRPATLFASNGWSHAPLGDRLRLAILDGSTRTRVSYCLNAKSSEERVVYKKAELNGNVDSENNHGGSSRTYVLHRTGCSQEDDQLLRQGCERQVHQEGQIGATRWELGGWMKTLPQPWTVAMEATIFTGWIYDHLLPHAQQVKVAHPLMLRAIAAAKKKNDRIDAGKIADCL